MGLFRVVSGPSYGLPRQGSGVNQGQLIGNGAMLNDRWASFMNRGLLGDPT